MNSGECLISSIRVLGFRNGVAEDTFLLRHDTAPVDDRIPTFLDNVVSSSPESVKS